MDPLTHTLVGASLARTRLAERTRRAGAALVIGANLPDIDVSAYFLGGDTALGFRRGWTHGLPALGVLPLLLWACLLLWDRWRPPPAAAGRLSRGWLLALAYGAALTHPALDWLNTYGMRWLMPFTGTWTYGDSVFIIDPWLWLILISTWRVGRKPERERLVATGLALAALYVASLLGLHAVTEERVRAALEHREVGPIEELMVGPEPANPLAWDVVARAGGRIRLGRYSWLGDGLELSARRLADARSSPDWAAVVASGQAQGFLTWVRFPWLEIEQDDREVRIYVMDARYVRRRTRGFGGTLVRLPR